MKLTTMRARHEDYSLDEPWNLSWASELIARVLFFIGTAVGLASAAGILIYTVLRVIA